MNMFSFFLMALVPVETANFDIHGIIAQGILSLFRSVKFLSYT